MMNPYSQNDLVRFLYGETTVSEDHDIAFLLEDDGASNAYFADLLQVKHILDNLKYKPRRQVVASVVQMSENEDTTSVQ